MEKLYYGYDRFVEDIRALDRQIAPFDPDTILAVARGGLTMGHFLAIARDTRRLFALNSIHYDGDEKLDTLEIFNVPDLSGARRILVVDDISDTGETLAEVVRIVKEHNPEAQVKVATLFCKHSSILQPDFCLHEARQWIDFFWEIDPLPEKSAVK
ncbi:phosphoribosyltransferase [Nitratifractor sp.]